MCSMNINSNKLSIAKAKEMDMVEYLSSLGFKPERTSGKNIWYLSPLHDEKTASFKVNRNLNRWYDFGEGKGGNLVDFATRYYNCSVSDALQKLSDNISPFPQVNRTQLPKDDENSQIKIIREQEISSFPLIRYLQKRRIPVELAERYCKEITYELYNKNYYALGFKNNAGGYELRNE
jgi:DNA primase